MASKKIKMARKMMTRQERLAGVPPFKSMAWQGRKIDRLVKELKKGRHYKETLMNIFKEFLPKLRNEYGTDSKTANT